MTTGQDTGDIWHYINYHNACRNSRCRVELTSNQSIPDNSWTKAQLDNIDFDNLNEWDTTNYRFLPTIPSGETRGYFVVWTYYMTPVDSYEITSAAIYLNGVNYSRFRNNNPFSGADISCQAIDIVPMTQNDYVECYVYHSGAGDADNIVSGPNTAVKIHRIY